jgi:hypothetical protein
MRVERENLLRFWTFFEDFSIISIIWKFLGHY